MRNCTRPMLKINPNLIDLQGEKDLKKYLQVLFVKTFVLYHTNKLLSLGIRDHMQMNGAAR